MHMKKDPCNSKAFRRPHLYRRSYCFLATAMLVYRLAVVKMGDFDAFVHEYYVLRSNTIAHVLHVARAPSPRHTLAVDFEQLRGNHTGLHHPSIPI